MLGADREPGDVVETALGRLRSGQSARSGVEEREGGIIVGGAPGRDRGCGSSPPEPRSMKKLPALLACALLYSSCASGTPDTASLTPPPQAPNPEVAFFVSPQGNDDNPGTEAAPFLTLERAQQQVRGLGSEWDADVSVNLMQGTYRRTQPLSFTAADSGQNGYNVIYRSRIGEHATITGAMPVTGFALSDPGKNIYSAFVGNRESRQLYVNGQPARRARTEDYPAGYLPAFVWIFGVPIKLGIEYIPTDLNPAEWRDPTTWTNVSEIEAVIVTQWKQMSVPVESIQPYPEFTVDPLLQPITLLFTPQPVRTGLIKMQEPGWTNANVFLLKDTMQPGPWSFWQVTRWENAYQFLDQPGEWYLDRSAGVLHYIPRAGEDMATAEVELPVLETLVQGDDVHHVRFEGLTFTGATWLEPGTGNGYVTDQSAFHLVGSHHKPNLWGHDQFTVRTPGNLSFRFSTDLAFEGNIFENLGAVALDLDTGTQRVSVSQNLFTNVSSSAIVLGGIDPEDARPVDPEQATRDNTIEGNLIRNVAIDYVDAAGIFVGFTARTTIQNNTIAEVPWSGIAMGWGWGLLDEGMFPGNPGSVRGEWGTYTTPTANSGNRVLRNRFYAWGNILWDTGAIYTQGQQGMSAADSLLIEGNVATDKRPSAGSNVFYTDGGSRYITLKDNVSANNPVGIVWFGPVAALADPLPYLAYGLVNCCPYGGEIGGCVTYGDIQYIGNYWANSTFYTPCPFTEGGVVYPTNLQFSNNHIIAGLAEVPARLVAAAGVQSQPDTIGDDKWVLPPGGPPGERTVVDCTEPSQIAEEFCGVKGEGGLNLEEVLGKIQARFSPMR